MMASPAVVPLAHRWSHALTGVMAARGGLVTALLVLPLLMLMVLAYVVPAGALAWMSFLASGPSGEILSQLTLGNYAKFFGDSWYVETLIRSFRIAIIVTIATVSLGYVVAYYLTFKRPRFFEAALILIIAPVLVGNVVRAFGWRFMMGDSGVVNVALQNIGFSTQPVSFMYTEHGIIIADTSVLLPLIILVLMGVLSRLDHRYVEAAKSLGASSFRAFWHVTLPLSLPGVGAASLICFTLAFGTFETAIFIGGGRVQMVAPLVYEQIGRAFNWPFGAAIAFIILAVSIVGIILHDTIVRENQA